MRNWNKPTQQVLKNVPQGGEGVTTKTGGFARRARRKAKDMGGPRARPIFIKRGKIGEV